MLPVLYKSPGFGDIPLKERQQAAWLARQRAFRHWQMWASLIAVCVLVVCGSVVAEQLWHHRWAPSLGAGVGIIFGGLIYRRTLFRFGLAYYREILSQRNISGG